MSTLFSQIQVNNNNSIDVDVTIEVPAGVNFGSSTIGPNSSKTFHINLQNIQTAKITATAAGHSGYSDIMSYDFSGSGSPYGIYITDMEATTTIGSIHGEVSVKF